MLREDAGRWWHARAQERSTSKTDLVLDLSLVVECRALGIVLCERDEGVGIGRWILVGGGLRSTQNTYTHMHTQKRIARMGCEGWAE